MGADCDNASAAPEMLLLQSATMMVKAQADARCWQVR